MEPFLIIIVPGLLGGVLFALLFARLHAGQSDADTRLAPPSPGLINMARIRVSGLGGLGMVAMSVVVAIFVPRIRVTMAIALVLGAAMAAVLIAQRRRHSPWNSQHPGAHSMLPNETPERSVERERDTTLRDGHQLVSPARP